MLSAAADIVERNADSWGVELATEEGKTKAEAVGEVRRAAQILRYYGNEGDRQTGEVVPYDPGYLAGWVVERYQVDLEEAAARSRQQMDATLRELCARQIPGDTYRNLVVQSTYQAERFKHVLAPVWLLTYVYGRRAYQVLVNGYTGKMAGNYPKSVWKILFLVLAILIVIGFVLMVQGSS